MKTTYIVIWIMVIREINNNNKENENWYLIYKNIFIYMYIYSIHINVNTQTYTHTIYNIFCIYQCDPIEVVQLIYWIHVDKNRI